MVALASVQHDWHDTATPLHNHTPTPHRRHRHTATPQPPPPPSRWFLTFNPAGEFHFGPSRSHALSRALPSPLLLFLRVFFAGNPHNRIGIKNTAPNLQKALLCVDSFAYGRTAGWKMTANILNPDNVDEDGLKNLFERIDTDKSGTGRKPPKKHAPTMSLLAGDHVRRVATVIAGQVKHIRTTVEQP